jgi:hypothetical protein
MQPTRTMLAAGVALALVVAACGGDDDTSAAGAGAGSGDGAGEVTTTTAPEAEGDGHDHGDHHHDYGEVVLANPLPTLPDGTIDPDRVDLGGVAGVTPEQQARAEDLLVRTVRGLPRWADVDQAIADGYQSIGDALTGEEHYLRWDLINDDVILDPEAPESLVYRVEPGGGRTLEAAMYILPDSYTFDNLPDLGGPLTQWHVHDDLCFTEATDTMGPQVAGITSVGGECPHPLVKFNPNAMIHVWIRPNECGPFASLLGVGAGQVAPGEERSCVRPPGELTL